MRSCSLEESRLWLIEVLTWAFHGCLYEHTNVSLARELPRGDSKFDVWSRVDTDFIPRGEPFQIEKEEMPFIRMRYFKCFNACTKTDKVLFGNLTRELLPSAPKGGRPRHKLKQLGNSILSNRIYELMTEIVSILLENRENNINLYLIFFSMI